MAQNFNAKLPEDNEVYLYNLGLLCGRFNPPHNGHKYLSNTGLYHCKKLLILIGSAQESGTLRNPYSFEMRKKMFEAIYKDLPKDRLIIKPINDLCNELNNNNSWGKYVIKTVKDYMGEFADFMIYGNDNCRSTWFDKEDIQDTTELITSRKTIPVSATMVRGYLVIDDYDSWCKVMPRELYPMYGELRRTLLVVPIYSKIYKEVLELGITMENFNLVYKKYEEADRKQKEMQLK